MGIQLASPSFVKRCLSTAEWVSGAASCHTVVILMYFYGLMIVYGNTNNNNKCIKERIMVSNKAYCANRQPVNSSLISRNSKLQIYRTLVHPVVTYGSESWTLTVEEERALAVFEREILRKIYGPVKENELWRIQRNDELEAIIKGENIVMSIKCQRIWWLGHIERMQDTAIPKKDVIRKAACNKTKRKTKTEMAGWRVHGPEKDGNKWMEGQSKGLRGLEAYCKGGQGPPRGAVAPSKKKKKKNDSLRCGISSKVLFLSVLWCLYLLRQFWIRLRTLVVCYGFIKCCYSENHINLKLVDSKYHIIWSMWNCLALYIGFCVLMWLIQNKLVFNLKLFYSPLIGKRQTIWDTSRTQQTGIWWFETPGADLAHLAVQHKIWQMLMIDLFVGGVMTALPEQWTRTEGYQVTSPLIWFCHSMSVWSEVCVFVANL